MAKKKIDPLNRKQYSAVSAALTVAEISAAVTFYQRAFGFTKRGIMKGPTESRFMPNSPCGVQP